MNRYHIFSFICFVFGISFFILAIFFGEAEGGIFIVFPFIVGSGILPFLGFICFFIAIILFSYGFIEKNLRYNSDLDFSNSSKIKNNKVKGGGIVIIGPVPIFFGTSWKITIILLILAIVIISTLFLFNLL
ncbi:hypothetical protein AYK20_00450 [Thermoplasmatales archaeon SG8-52-1]|nr:MAG: hypothetical protein AYK20_00450 [Thermoplasmatales archaeon SG8-52-1]